MGKLARPRSRNARNSFVDTKRGGRIQPSLDAVSQAKSWRIATHGDARLERGKKNCVAKSGDAARKVRAPQSRRGIHHILAYPESTGLSQVSNGQDRLELPIDDPMPLPGSIPLGTERRNCIKKAAKQAQNGIDGRCQLL
jgi:hypothetical protein